jgi:hypothetical protein
MPYNPDDLMVQCEECSEWFHPSCIGTTIEEAKKPDNFYCEECSPQQQNLHNSNSTSNNRDAKVFLYFSFQKISLVFEGWSNPLQIGLNKFKVFKLTVRSTYKASLANNCKLLD